MADLEVKGALVGRGGRRQQSTCQKTRDRAYKPPVNQHSHPPAVRVDRPRQVPGFIYLQTQAPRKSSSLAEKKPPEAEREFRNLPLGRHRPLAAPREVRRIEPSAACCARSGR